VTVQHDVSYGPSDSERLDAYLPTTAPAVPTPAVIFIHGGGWSVGDKSEWSSDASNLVTQTGWAGFAVNYVLTSSTPYVDEPAQVEAAVAWVKSHAAQYHVNPAAIGLLGESAGGNLALLAADNGTGPSSAPGRVKAVVSWSGITDPAGLVTQQGCAASQCDKVRQGVGWMLENNFEKSTQATDPARWAATAPVLQVDRTDPPALLVNSVNEFVPLNQLNAMAGAMEANGVQVSGTVLPGNRHAMDYNTQEWPEALAYLVRHLAG
jgi:acetyl esterase/lipase